jgi:hypothetical protein
MVGIFKCLMLRRLIRFKSRTVGYVLLLPDLVRIEKKQSTEECPDQTRKSASDNHLRPQPCSDKSVDSQSPAVPVHRSSRRANRGQHRRFAEAESKPETSIETLKESCSKEEPCTITLALEAFVKEEEEENSQNRVQSPVSDQSKEKQSVKVNSGGRVKRLRKRRRFSSEDSSDPDDPLASAATSKKKTIDTGDLENCYVPPDRLLELTHPFIVRQSINNRRGNGGGTMELFKCRQCDYSRRQEAAVVQHVAAQHLNVWTIVCRLCGQLERVAARMEHHLNTRHQLTREVVLPEPGEPHYFSGARNFIDASALVRYVN